MKKITVEEIIEGVFLHGKETPNYSYNLPEGQYTIAEAINLIKKLIKN